MNAWMYEVIESLEHGLIVKDILPWDMNVKQGLTSKSWGVCLAPSGYWQWDGVSHKIGSGLQVERRTTPSWCEDYPS